MGAAGLLLKQTKPIQWLVKGIVILILLFIVYKIYVKFKKNIDQGKRDREIQHDIKDIINTQGTDPGAHVSSNVRTYKDADYKLMAESLYSAMDGVGTDEGTIFSIISSLRTKADWYALVDAFGTRETSSMWSDFKGTLTKWLSDELSDSEKERVNQTLSKFDVARI
jgi:hypothetical protein